MRLHEFDQKDNLNIILKNATVFSKNKLVEFKKLVSQGLIQEHEFLMWANEQIDKEIRNEFRK